MPVDKFVQWAKGWLNLGEKVQAPPGVRATFLLTYDELPVGTLSVQDGMWRFAYSDEFKQSDLRPIVEFPDVNRVYEREDLWQFFAMRIPSPEQPEVEQIIKQERINGDDAVTLLKRFGRRTIANPFQLEFAA
jgi:HipA-like protein